MATAANKGTVTVVVHGLTELKRKICLLEALVSISTLKILRLDNNQLTSADVAIIEKNRSSALRLSLSNNLICESELGAAIESRERAEAVSGDRVASEKIEKASNRKQKTYSEAVMAGSSKKMTSGSGTESIMKPSASGVVGYTGAALSAAKGCRQTGKTEDGWTLVTYQRKRNQKSGRDSRVSMRACDSRGHEYDDGIWRGQGGRSTDSGRSIVRSMPRPTSYRSSSRHATSSPVSSRTGWNRCVK